MTADLILIVDDSAAARAWLIDQVLRPAGYAFIEAASLGEARAQISTNQPQLIVLDAQLAAADRLALLHECGQHIPIIVTTCRSIEAMSAALDAGAVDVIIGPFDPQRVATAVARALRQARLLREQIALRELAERQAREHSRLNTILYDMRDVVIVTDADTRVLLANHTARETFGLSDGVIGEFLTKIPELQPLTDLFEQRHSDEQAWRAEIELPDGHTLQGQLSRLNGVGYSAVLRDITRLKELDRIKSEFVSIVSHDLRTPLTTIRGYVNLLPRVGPLNEVQQDFVTRVERSMDNIVDLIADLLDIGKIEAGVDWEMMRVPLHSLVRAVADRLKANADLHGHTLTVEAPELPPVLGNARRLEQVVANLIGNAIKYTPDGGWIEVSLREDGDYEVIQVRDNGIGIALEDQRYIFDKFYRVESELTDKISGTGLGLSIVRAIVKKHAGRVWVESEVGRGSTFTVLLPKYLPGED